MIPMCNVRVSFVGNSWEDDVASDVMKKEN